MSSTKEILDEIKDRCNVLREHIDRGRYDGKRDAFQDKLQQFIGEGYQNIHKFYKNKHGMVYKLKSKKDENSDKQKILETVKSYQDDLTNRLGLVNYYIKRNVQDPNKCRDMSQEKCGRAKNTTVCQWVPGSDELAEWATRKAWNERKEGDELPQYVGTNLHQKPRGCYPITKTKVDMKAIANVRKQKEGVAFGLKLPPKDDLTEAEQAEAEIQRKPLTEAQKEKMQKKKLQYAEMLKKLRATKSKTGDPTYETKQGGRKRRTKKRKRRKRKKTKTQKNKTQKKENAKKQNANDEENKL